VTAAPNPIDSQIYRELPDGFYTEVVPSPNRAPALLELNVRLLADYGVDESWFRTPAAAAILTGHRINVSNPPVALAYAGHQFGHWVPLLGDGRASMLGQLRTYDGGRIDVQLKGSGRTRYSRGGDGRATLGSVLREYLVSEAMAGLSIPTTRSLAVLATGDPVTRDRIHPGAVLARTARSHVRVGTFQHAAVNHGPDAVRALADHVIAHHFENLQSEPDQYARLLESVITRQARMIASWMLVGFIHGVMNTDNMSIVGETIDYGPCAFMDEFHPAKVFSSIDRRGRYAWQQQPAIAHWNLTRLAEALLPLLAPASEQAVTIAEQRLAAFAPQFDAAFHEGLGAKLGFAARSDASDAFGDTTLQLLSEQSLDFTLFFDRLTRVAADDNPEQFLTQQASVDAGDAAGESRRRQGLHEWLAHWRTLRTGAALDVERMRRANPVLIARNHRVEQAIAAAELEGHLRPFRRLAGALRSPYEIAPADQDLLLPPQPAERVRETFCGT